MKGFNFFRRWPSTCPNHSRLRIQLRNATPSSCLVCLHLLPNNLTRISQSLRRSDPRPQLRKAPHQRARREQGQSQRNANCRHVSRDVAGCALNRRCRNVRTAPAYMYTWCLGRTKLDPPRDPAHGSPNMMSNLAALQATYFPKPACKLPWLFPRNLLQHSPSRRTPIYSGLTRECSLYLHAHMRRTASFIVSHDDATLNDSRVGVGHNYSIVVSHQEQRSPP